MTIHVNTLIEFRNNEMETIAIERVLWISPDLEDIVLFNIDKERRYLPTLKSYTELEKALDTPYVSILTFDPYKVFNAPEQNYLDKHKKIRDKRWAIIKEYVEKEPFIYEPDLLKEMVAEIKKKTGERGKIIYATLREYWRGGKTINTLLPNYSNSGGRGKPKNLKDKKIGRPSKLLIEKGIQGVNVTEVDKEIFELGIKLFYKGKKTTLKKSHEEIIKKYYIAGYKTVNGVVVPIALPDEQIPNYRQFLNWYNSTYNTKEKLINKNGERKYYLNHRPLLGDATNKAAGPGDIFEIDATIGDIYLVSEIDRSRIIGRPVVYIVKNVYTRMVAGVYVGLEGPSWIGAMMALENASTNKTEYCKNLGIDDFEDEDWPCEHLPKRIKADRGEMESKNADNLVASLGIQIINAPPYRADLKGIVERHFRILNERISQHWMPGIVHKDYKERGGRDYRLDAKLTLKAFERVIVLTILEHNHSVLNGYALEKEMMEINLLPTPINLWNWGLKHRSGLLKTVDRDLIRLNLMHSKEVSITAEGIVFNKMRYSSDFCIENAWFEQARIKRWKEVIYYDPRDIQHIYIKMEGNKFIKCHLVDADQRYSQFRLEEVQEQQFIMDVNKALQATSQRQLKIDTNAQIEKIMKDEKRDTNEMSDPDESKAARLRDIRENRKNEKEFLRGKEHWGNTLEPDKDQYKAEVIEMKNFINHEIEDDEDYLLDLIIQHDEKEGM